MTQLPFSQACENNKGPILDVLQRHLVREAKVLEIAGGTGQHAVHFASRLPHLYWQTSDIPSNVATLNLRLAAAALPNLPLAVSIDVTQDDWPFSQADHVFSANSLHIMSTVAVEAFFCGLQRLVNSGGLVLVYGPFKYGGEFTTPSNANFDVWLKGNNPLSGVRDFEWVNELAAHAGLTLLEDNAMPANNQLLIWKKH